MILLNQILLGSCASFGQTQHVDDLLNILCINIKEIFINFICSGAKSVQLKVKSGNWLIEKLRSYHLFLTKIMSRNVTSTIKLHLRECLHPLSVHFGI
jgi:hypothetical protein